MDATGGWEQTSGLIADDRPERAHRCHPDSAIGDALVLVWRSSLGDLGLSLRRRRCDSSDHRP